MDKRDGTRNTQCGRREGGYKRARVTEREWKKMWMNAYIHHNIVVNTRTVDEYCEVTPSAPDGAARRGRLLPRERAHAHAPTVDHIFAPRSVAEWSAHVRRDTTRQHRSRTNWLRRYVFSSFSLGNSHIRLHMAPKKRTVRRAHRHSNTHSLYYVKRNAATIRCGRIRETGERTRNHLMTTTEPKAFVHKTCIEQISYSWGYWNITF